jgi:hypothetical protein
MKSKEQSQVPLFAYLHYEVLQRLEITIPEYWYLDMVYQLSRDGWCYKSLDHIAKDMRMTKNGVMKMRERLTERGLVIKGRAGRVRTSEKYNSVYFTNKRSYNSVTKNTTEYTFGVQLSIPKNNKENNKEKGIKTFGGRGEPSPAKEKLREMLRKKGLSRSPMENKENV